MIVVSFVAGALSLVLALASLLRRKPSAATWCFLAGMATLGLDSILGGLAFRTSDPAAMTFWLTGSLVTKALVPAIWLGFSLTYSRGDYGPFVRRWRIPLALFAALPLVVLLNPGQALFDVVPVESLVLGDVRIVRFGGIAKALCGALIVALVLILTNLEQTFRAATGTMRWRIKLVLVALAIVFATRIYVRSQVILFSALDPALTGIESGGLLIGCCFLTLAYFRTGWAESDVHPSLAVLRSSLTILVVGGYLFVVGVVAQIVRRFGGAEIFQYQVFVALVGLAGLAVLLLSDHFRQNVHRFAARHFSRAQYDSVRVWTLLSRGLATVPDQASLSAASVRLVSETFDVLSATIWMLNEHDQLSMGASTTRRRAEEPDGRLTLAASADLVAGLRSRSAPFDLEEVQAPWAETLRRLNVTTFVTGGHRWCVPLRSGERILGVLVLADRVGGAEYTIEELELLTCIADHTASVLLNVRLTDEVVRAREMEVFRTMSAFFVHDLKNATSSLNLMLRNVPVHFDDPEFRADALRTIDTAVRRIDDMIIRLSALRQLPASRPADADLNEIVSEALDRIGPFPSVDVSTALEPVPAMTADRHQIQSVVTNLVLNARDALGPDGRIQVRTEHRAGRVVLSVSDNGCGMTSAFVRESLFRPFQSTKTRGLGIGLFQARAIVQAHGGTVQVESEPGRGTTFQVVFPAKDVQ